jgi:hypothetical protein
MLEEDRARKIQNFAHWATIFAVAGSLFAFAYGAWASVAAARSQARASAVGILQDYFKLAIEHQDLANRPDEQPVDDRYEWFASHAYFTAETIFTLTDEDEWRNTVRGIIRLHHPYVRDGRFACEDFNPRFVEFVRSELPVFKCAGDSASILAR